MNAMLKKEFARKLRIDGTPSEQLLWEQIRNKRFLGFKFRRQPVIDFLRQQVIEQKGLDFLRIKTEEIDQGLPMISKWIETRKKLSKSLPSLTTVGEGLGVRALFATVFLFFFMACQDTGSSHGMTREQYRTGATALFQQQLYQEAIDLYRAYLASPVVASEDVPKVLYQIGSIYQDQLKQPQAALAQYTLVKSLFPEQAFAPDLGKRMVACLEASGRSSEASQALSSLTKLSGDSNSASVGEGAVVAEVDGRKVTAGDVAAAVGGKLPDAPVEQAQVIRQYVGELLLAQSARRRGMAEKADVKRLLELAENQILAQSALREDLKIAPPQADDLKYYYEANKTRYQHGPDSGATFDKLEPRVRADWVREKQAAAYTELVQKLIQAAQVRFYGGGQG